MAITLVQRKINSGLFTNPVFTSNSTALNTYVAWAIWNDPATTITLTNVSDGTNTLAPVAGTLVHVAGVSGRSIYVQAAVLQGIAGVTTPTFTPTWSSAPAGWLVDVWELSSTATYQTVTANGSGTTISAGNIVTTVDGAYALAASHADDGIGRGTDYGAGTGWTAGTMSGGGSWEWGDEQQAQAAHGTLTGDFTFINDTPSSWVASMIAFELAGGAVSDPMPIQQGHTAFGPF